ncbi:PREDICTED: tyrosine-protein phosphatase Lar-like [Priapulus caudatus]|uniref:Tyrosine-protein phosphatase Lar-like n=1 Tax=Priapulus caudatus TaxID=37621 RepID=A0ABM1FAW1_PRICU|nr:PREDICTED: tyrosine-protein phosphatase Lar-like [Priapulus caudatus]
MKGYTVYYTDNPSQDPKLWLKSEVKSGQVVTIGDLRPQHTYTVRVRGYNSVGLGPLSQPVQVLTEQGVPTQPIHLEGTATSPNTIQLNWQEPFHAADSITRYELYYNDSTTGKSIHLSIQPSTSYLMQNLIPNTVYTVRMSASSQRGEGVSTHPVQIRTVEFVPGGPPRDVRANAVDARNVRVTWRPPQQTLQHGAITQYHVVYMPTDEVDDALARTVSVPASRRELVLRDLDVWTLYSVWMYASTAVGDGPPSDRIQVRTSESVPGEPRKVRVYTLNSTVVRVEWRNPAERERNGIIRGYHIHVQRLARAGGDPVGPPKKFETTADQEEYIVTGLSPETWYSVQVAAYTRAGDGKRSRGKTAQTPGGVPNAPQMDVKLNRTRDGVINARVEWSRPTATYGALLGYRLEYGKVGEQLSRPLELEDINFFNFQDLDKGSTYEFRLTARNEENYGEAAVRMVATPDGVPDGAPENLTYWLQTPTVMRLSWLPPVLRDRNGNITMYTVQYYKQHDHSGKIEYNTTNPFMIVPNLELDRIYYFSVRAHTSQGAGPWSEHLRVGTTEDAPVAPTEVKAVPISQESVEVSWQPVDMPSVIGYEIFYALRAVEDMSQWNTVKVGGRHTMSVVIENMERMATYAIQVGARTAKGIGVLSNHAFVTVDPKRVPMNVMAVLDPTEDKVVLSWQPPMDVIPIKYWVSYGAMKTFKDEYGQNNTVIFESKSSEVSVDQLKLTVEDLAPNTVYHFNVSAVTIADGVLPAARDKTRTHMRAPSVISAPVFRGATGHNTLKLELFRASEKWGPIDHYLVAVVPADMIGKDPEQFTLKELDVDTRDKTSSGRVPGPSAYIAARFRSDDYPTYPKYFELGDGVRYGNYYNRELVKDQEYRVFVRAVVVSQGNSLPTSTPFSEPISLGADVMMASGGPEDDNIFVVIGPIIAAVLCLFAVIALIVFLYRRKRRTPKSPEPTKVAYMDVPTHPSDPVEMRRLNFQTPGMMNHPPIPYTELADHIERLKASDCLKFSQEYESIEPGQQFTWEHSNKEYNKHKNRYANVIAYDHSRVILQPLEGIPGSDYINANYCDGYRKQNAYIATQGPLGETFGDFWRLMWEQRSATIVMMTRLEERNRIKCDQYWPSRGTETYGPMQVTIVEVTELATYTIRTFVVSRMGYPDKREVKQFQFTAWPDHGVPEYPTPVLAFLRRVRAMTPPESGPMVIHCSAGVGRTGAFIVIDAMLERIRHEKTVDIYGHVTCLRAQRNYMVQTEDQYVFIHDALLEAVSSGNTEVPARSLYTHMQRLMQPEPGENVTGMELEFKRLANVKAQPSRFISANLPVNKFKNRLVNILPYESTRVCLQPIRGVDGSDYINASWIDGYRYRNAYIATQGPLPETTEDFWRVLWEHNSTIIVMLTKLREMGRVSERREKCHQYWPSERSARYQYFVVDPIAEYNMPQYILREFKVTDARDGQSRTVRQFQFTDWPEQGVPKSGEGFIDFIGQVHKTKDQFGQDGPITIHCSAGVGRTGVFITLSIVLERMRYEGVVDMFQTVKTLRTQRPCMVQTEDQYQFCYKAALEYLGSFDHYAT